MTGGKNPILIGAPVECGSHRRGCVMGPSALRTAGLTEALVELGLQVEDRGDVTPGATVRLDGTAETQRAACASWIEPLASAAYTAAKDGLPIFLGGDHLMAAGTVTGTAKAARERGQEPFVLWVDAHPDLHDLSSTATGNLHGTPVAYFTGHADFTPHFPVPLATVPPANVCMIGLRSVDAAERAILAGNGSGEGGAFEVSDMRALDEGGIAAPLRRFLARVAAVNGALHVSFDVDFLDPSIAPAVGTTVPGGATFREAHLVMEVLCDSGLVTSLDVAELNPFLDERGRTANLLVDLVASLFGKSVLDRPNRS